MARNPLYPFRSGGSLLGGGDPFLALHRDVNRLFDEAFRGVPASGGHQQGSSGTIVHAHMNVSETENAIRITAELPGVTLDDVEVTLDDDVLTIRGEKKFEQSSERENFHVVERSYGTFQRSLRLPYPIDPEQVEANFEHGVLTVTLPKTGRQERSRKIQVQSGRGGLPGISGMARFYMLLIERDLFGIVRLVRTWGRIGTRGRERADVFDTEEDAAEAMQRLAARKRTRGYQDL